MTTVAKELTESLTRIRKYGWVQGHIGNTTTGFCLIGCLPLIPSAQTVGVLEATVGALYPIGTQGHGLGLAAWNDEPARTRAEVEEVLEIAIEHAKGAGL